MNHDRDNQPASWRDLHWTRVLGLGIGAVFAVAALVLLPDVVLSQTPWRVRAFVAAWYHPVLLIAATIILATRLAPSRLPAPVPFGWRDIPAVAACSALGVYLFTLPDLIWWRRVGALVWVGDMDDVLYLSVASQAYHNHLFHLSDPSRAVGGVSLYYWLPLGPGILLAKLLDLGPVAIGPAWRALAGASLPLGWYLLVRRFVPSALITAFVVILLTTDIGSMFGAPLIHQATLARQLSISHIHPWLRTSWRPAGVQWRVLTPGEIFIAFAIYLTLLLRAHARPSRGRIATAGAAFGMLFYIYFYYWTAAGLALLLGVLVDRGRRRVHLHVGWIGALIGLPWVVVGMLKHDASAEAFTRFNLFLPIGRLSEFFWTHLESGMLAACLIWIGIRRRDLLPIGLLATAGWLLVNQHVISGLLLQNDHWRLHVVGPMLTLMMVLVFLDALLRLRGMPRRVALGALAAVCLLDVLAGISIRRAEATSAIASQVIMDVELQYRARRRHFGAVRLKPNAVTGGDEGFVDWSAILDNQRVLYSTWQTRHSLTIDNAEWNRRIALNGYLRGLSRVLFEFVERDRINRDFFGPWLRDKPLRARLLADRMACYDAVAADPVGALDHFGVRYAGLDAGSSPPLPDSGVWRLIETGPRWWIWERDPDSRQPGS